MKRLMMLLVIGFIGINLCGCAIIMGMLADSAKAKQNINVPYEKALDIVKEALKATEVRFRSAEIRPDIAEVKGKYTDGKDVRIFISKISDNESRISVRVGTSTAGKKDAEKILKAIIEYADLVIKK